MSWSLRSGRLALPFAHAALPPFLGLFLLCIALAGRAADLPPGVAKALAAAGVPVTNVGLVIQNLDADTPLVAYGEHRSFNPASVMKLLTTFAALDSLGPAYTFKTRVWVDGEVHDGVLKGDLILQGGAILISRWSASG